MISTRDWVSLTGIGISDWQGSSLNFTICEVKSHLTEMASQHQVDVDRACQGEVVL
jgi:hypothetical protein